MQHFADVAPLRRTGIELSVGESPGTAFAVAIIGIRIHHAFARQARHIEFAGVDVFAPFQHHGLQAQRQELERREHSGRAGTYHKYGRGVTHIQIRLLYVFGHLLPRPVSLILVAPDRLLAGIHGALAQHPFQPSGLSLNLLQPRLPRQRAGNLEFFHTLQNYEKAWTSSALSEATYHT